MIGLPQNKLRAEGLGFTGLGFRVMMLQSYKGFRVIGPIGTRSISHILKPLAARS